MKLFNNENIILNPESSGKLKNIGPRKAAIGFISVLAAVCSSPSGARPLHVATIASGNYRAHPNAEASVTHGDEGLTIYFIGGGDPSDGASIGADCEMMASLHGDRWELIPFESEIMTVGDHDISGLYLNIRYISYREFEVKTNYDVSICAEGVRLSGRYMRRE